MRRLSSIDASRADLYSGPNVIVPPDHLRAPLDTEDIAIALELAKQRLNEASSSTEVTPRPASPVQRPVVETTDNFALAFDIDGVLVKGGEALPESIDAMKYINGDNPYNVKM